MAVKSNTLRIGTKFYILDPVGDEERKTYYRVAKNRPLTPNITRWWKDDPKCQQWWEQHALAVMSYGMEQGRHSTMHSGCASWIDGRVTVHKISWWTELKDKLKVTLKEILDRLKVKR